MPLNDQQFMRYSRHLLMDDIGEEGQLTLLNAHVLIVGMGGLETELAVGGGGRLQVGGKAAAVLVCSHHGDGARNDGSDGDGAQFALGGIAAGLVAILRQGDQAPPQEP